jgi:hypothetical protein
MPEVAHICCRARGDRVLAMSVAVLLSKCSDCGFATSVRCAPDAAGVPTVTVRTDPRVVPRRTGTLNRTEESDNERRSSTRNSGEPRHATRWAGDLHRDRDHRHSRSASAGTNRWRRGRAASPAACSDDSPAPSAHRRPAIASAGGLAGKGVAESVQSEPPRRRTGAYAYAARPYYRAGTAY